MNLKTLFIFQLAACYLLLACRSDLKVLTPEEVELPSQKHDIITGFYLLNEGNMNANKASIDYYDYQTGVYQRNIYEQANPQLVKGLGDVGNDLGVYGNKLYVVVNLSNKLEILDCKSRKRLKVIAITNCRYVCFNKGYAYVSAYDGGVSMGPNAPFGNIYKIDTLSMTITDKVQVGRQPEEMAIVNNKLYVANSGGYSPPHYEHTISVINLNTFTKIKNIDVAINLHRMKADRYGDIYVSSRGDYYDIPAKLYAVDSKTDTVKACFDIAASNFCIVRDTAYIIASSFSKITSEWKTDYVMLNVKTESIISQNFITDGSQKNIQVPYGIAVDSISGYIYLTDAKDYVSPGMLYCFSNKGKKLYTVITGDIPAHIGFVHKNNSVLTSNKSK